MRFAENTQHDTSKVLRLPRKMTWEVSKVLRLPRKMQRIFWKRGKSIAPATQNDFWHVMKHVGMSQSATPATQNNMTACFETFNKDGFCSLPQRQWASEDHYLWTSWRDRETVMRKNKLILGSPDQKTPNLTGQQPICYPKFAWMHWQWKKRKRKLLLPIYGSSTYILYIQYIYIYPIINITLSNLTHG